MRFAPKMPDIVMKEEKERLSPREERLFVEALDQIPNLSDRGREDAILMFAGFKRATTILVPLATKKQSTPEPTISEEEKNRISDRITALLKKSNVESVKMKRARYAVAGSDTPGPHNDGWEESDFFSIAKKREDAEAYAKVQKLSREDPEYNRIMGELSGYPQTAIEAFNKENAEAGGKPLAGGRKNKYLLSLDELPKEARKKDYVAFHSFMLSKDHWEEELETVKQWAETIRMYDPALYTRIVEKYLKDSFKS